MTIPTYSTGTVSVSAGGTTVTGTGVIWTGGPVKETDRISIDGGADILITELTDSNHLEIPPWAGGDKVDVPYVIYQNYPVRVVGVAAAIDAGDIFARLKTGGLPFLLAPDETEPDPSLGADGQYAHDPVTGAWWLKTGGLWVESSAPVAGYGGTSTTSLLIANSVTRVFATQAGLAYNGARVRAASDADPENYMEGVCTYSGTTLTMTVDAIGGSGTKADWVFSIAGNPSVGALLSANNLSDVANAATARVNLSAASFSRSSNTVLALADHDALVVATSTFTQTFTAAATLGSGWRIWYRNNGTGIITFDPNSSETIDGATTLKIYPGEECLITCDGSAFYTSGLGDRVVLETKVLSSAATADFLNFDNTRFSRYEFQFLNVYPSTNTAALWCRVSTDGGSSYVSAASSYAHHRLEGATLTSVNSDTKIVICSSVDNIYTRGASFLADLITPVSGASNIVIRGRFLNGGASDVLLSAAGFGGITVNGLRFLFSTGNIGSGTIRHIGLR